jgi:type IV pilus assembly protein PilB
MSVNMSGIARRLVADNLLAAPQAQAAIKLAARDNIPFVTHLLDQKLLPDSTIAAAAASEFGSPLLQLSAFDLQYCPDNLVDLRLIKQHQLLPLFRRGKHLYVAVSDPSNLRAVDEIKFHTGLSIELVIAAADELSATILEFIERQENIHSLGKELAATGINELRIEEVKGDTLDERLSAADEAPIVRFVNKILLDAVKAGASDIHIEPYEKIYRVRFRIDGILQEIAHPPIHLANRIASRLKILSLLDISEKRVPQDGRFKVRFLENHSTEFRLNILPTLWGEKIVLRLLDSRSARIGIDALGFETDQKQQYLQALNLTQGLILVTGPTGSGKSISLYTGLDILNSPARNISTVEDPVEINLEGINQVAVNEKLGLGFAAALRAFLRQDPDVIMVGEIRDLETAEIAIKAAQTGHLVLTTLHTNNAAEALTRLNNMGIPAYNLATSLHLIIAQRLARCLCNHCKESVEIPEKLLIEEGFTPIHRQNLRLFRARGCERCNHGYKGRVGIYELVPVSAELSSLIMAGANSLQLTEQLNSEGIRSLRQSALLKVATGLISLEEANRLT